MREDHVKLIKQVQLPSTNNYYELTSADGYSWLAYALSKINETDKARLCINKVHELNYRLNADRVIARTKTKVFKKTDYTYTLSFCIDLFKELLDEETLEILYNKFIDIGYYTNGMYRYCDTEIYYGTPNVTAGAAYVFALMGDLENVKKCLSYLKNNQLKNGNWNYLFINEKENKITNSAIEEDTCHLAMIVFYLRMIEKITKINTKEIYKLSIKRLEEINKNQFDLGTIGWGIPMLYLALKGTGSYLTNKVYKEVINNSINHSNFRVRSLSAYSLIKKYD